MRLSAFISRSGYCSRRKAADLVKEGKVKIGGKVIAEPWHIIKDGDAVSVNGKLVRSEKFLYLIVNKPKGVTTTIEDPYALRKITEILPKRSARLYPIGRLDKDSKRLIILTNDGDLCYRLTHPKFEIEKEYIATVKGQLDEVALKRLRSGVFSEGEMLKVKAYFGVKSVGGSTIIHLVIAEGKKRHLRRMFKGIGSPVVDLKRIRIGGLRLGELREGAFEKIDRDTMYRLALMERKRSHA
jgi:23S rRNA pseudouridine2605 synthase